MHQLKSSVSKLFQSVSILFLLCYATFGQEWTWRPFNPKNQPWTVLAPGPMQPDAEAQKPGSNKGTYAYNDYNGFFAIIYRETPKRWLPWKPDYSNYVKEVREGVVTANKGELLKENDFSNRGMSGREAFVKYQTGTTRGIEGQVVAKYRVQRFRMFFSGNRFYIILAVLNENEIESPAINNYFNSFAVNTAPTAVDNSYSVDEDGNLTVNAGNGVLSNDKDAEDNKLSVSGSAPVTPPAHGSLKLNADGSFGYQPEPNYNGTDTFTYKANDGLIDSTVATVSVTVKPVNDAPTISGVPSSQSIDELTPLSFTAVGNDIDNPVSSLRFSLTGAPAGATINPNTGVLSWTPTEAQGPGNFTFKVNVSDGALSASSTVSVTVKEVNVAPQFSNAPTSATINELEPYSFVVKATDSDIPAQSLTYSIVGAPEGASINPTTGVITWAPTEAQGNDSTYKFTVRVSDGVTNSDVTANLTVKEVNSAPTLVTIADQTIDELKPLCVVTRGSDADLPANNLKYSLEAGAPAGMTIDAGTGAISWTPTEQQGPNDYSVTVRLTDNGTPSMSDTKTFKVHVNEINLAPSLAAIGNKTIDEETLLSFNANAADTDLPANTLSYSLINAPAGASINPSTGAFTWTPTETQGAGTYTMTVRVTDSGTPALSAEEIITITVNEVNKPPMASDIAINTDEDTAASLTLKVTDADLPANTLRYIIVNPPAHGRVTGNAPNLTYTPDANFNGTDNFTFKVNDGAADSNTAIVNINIKPVNDIPVANQDNATTDGDTPVSINVLANDTDVDGDKLTLTNTSNVTNGKVEIVGGEAKFTPNAGFSGAAAFSYTISDGKGGTATGRVSVTVNLAKPKP